MSQTMAATSAWPRRVHTKIVGTTFEGRQDLLAECKRLGITGLRLVPDPANRYDPYAVGVEAEVNNGNGNKTIMRLGFLSNSDHVCSDCGGIVGNAMFQNSKIVRCGECETMFNIGAIPGERTICPACGYSFETAICKVVTCPRCGGTDFGRGGLATRIFRAMTAGMNYRATVMEYTGGSQGKSIGCNILLEAIGGGTSGRNP